MKSSKANQRMTILTLMVALGAAVYLNWEYAKSTEIAVDAQPAGAQVEVTELSAEGDDAVVTDALPTDVEEGDKNYGEAQLVSVGEADGSSFFDNARMSRTKTRDEALDTLQKTLKKSKLSDEEKKTMTEELSKTVENIELESEIESLVKAKGFVDCVAFVDSDKVNLTVMTSNDGLTKEEVAQIRDIVLSKCKVTARDITVVEVK